MKRSALLSISCLAITAACGGGGSGGVAPTPTGSTPSSPPPASASTPYDEAKKTAEDAFNADLSARLSAAEDWLDTNAMDASVRTLESGLQYRVVKTGNSTGDTASQFAVAKLHFDASTAEGRIFNSSFQRGSPVELNTADMISGWQKAVAQMNPGDEWIVYLHPSLAYGEAGYGASVPPNSVTVYRIALIDRF